MERIFAVILATLVVSGCASITRGTTEVFVIESTPSNARATLSTGLSCKTPCSIKVPRRGDFIVTVELDGYEPATANVVSKVDGDGTAGLAGNVLFGGIIGAGIDAGSGAMQSHTPNPLQVTLLPIGATPAGGAVPVEDASAGVAEEPGEEAVDDLAGVESSE